MRFALLGVIFCLVFEPFFFSSLAALRGVFPLFIYKNKYGFMKLLLWLLLALMKMCICISHIHKHWLSKISLSLHLFVTSFHLG